MKKSQKKLHKENHLINNSDLKMKLSWHIQLNVILYKNATVNISEILILNQSEIFTTN